MRSLKVIFILLTLACAGGTTFAQSEEAARLSELNAVISKNVHVYPNPAVEFVNLRFESIEVTDLKVSLHNLIGNEMSVETEKIDKNTVRIKVKDLAAGYYLIGVRHEGLKFTSTYKFLKK